MHASMYMTEGDKSPFPALNLEQCCSNSVLELDKRLLRGTSRTAEPSISSSYRAHQAALILYRFLLRLTRARQFHGEIQRRLTPRIMRVIQ